MELQTKDLTLKSVTTDDVGEVARAWNFEKGEISLEEAQNAIDGMQRNHRMNKARFIYHICFAICEKGKREIIGWCGLDGTGERGGGIYIFYMIASQYRRRGYATQCAARLLEFAFREYGIKHVDGGCAKENEASYRVLKKIGMSRNGSEKNGDPLFYIDEVMYSSRKQ